MVTTWFAPTCRHQWRRQLTIVTFVWHPRSSTVHPCKKKHAKGRRSGFLLGSFWVPVFLFNCFSSLLNFPTLRLENRPTSHHSQPANKKVGILQFLVAPLSFTGRGCMVGDQTCMWCYGWTQIATVERGLFSFRALRVGLSDVKASECWKWWQNFKISLQWKGERSPVIIAGGVDLGGSLLKMIQFLRGQDSIRDDV